MNSHHRRQVSSSTPDRTRSRGFIAARRRVTRALAVAAIIAVASTVSIVGQVGAPAYAVDYPTWGDVEAARGNEAAKQAEIGRIQTLLAQLAQQTADAKALEIQRGNEFQAAQQAFDEASVKAAELQQQADEASAIAEESKLKAGQLAARMAKTGGEDVSASLFFDSGSADDLLSQLGMASKISDSSAGIYSKARQDQNTAQSLTDQANVARNELEALAAAAQAALEAAADAAEAAIAAEETQQENKAVLDAQLAVLSENRAATEADFEAGERYRAEQRRIAEEQAAAARAAEAARAAQFSSSQTSSGPSSAPGQISSSGWTRPGGGGFTSSYGNRVHPITGVWTFHAGTDIQAGCGAPTFAASSGTVTYAGWNGGYGNYISIDHGNGQSTAYGHIQNGGMLVSRGQQVQSGQLIARVGTTGGSTGCHIHFETRINGAPQNPVDFMRARGASL